MPPSGTSTGGSPGTQRGTRRDASMLLLSNLMENSLDEGYASAAARRGSDGQPPSRNGRLLLTVGLLAVGLLLATAAAQTRDRASVTAEARSALSAEIEDRSAANDRLERSLEEARAAAARDRRAALRLTAEGARLDQQLTELEASTGAAAVAGPGMVVRLEDARDVDGADTDPRTGDATEGRVTDRDLQTVVNEVWVAGAEAVAINGQRLTGLSAIRAAGEAILVDFRPLNPPYEVRAVGPPSMRTRFVEGFGGSYLQVLRDYGIDYAVEDADRLRLPASGGVAVRYATVPTDVPSGASAPSNDDTSR